MESWLSYTKSQRNTVRQITGNLLEKTRDIYKKLTELYEMDINFELLNFYLSQNYLSNF